MSLCRFSSVLILLSIPFDPTGVSWAFFPSLRYSLVLEWPLLFPPLILECLEVRRPFLRPPESHDFFPFLRTSSTSTRFPPVSTGPPDVRLPSLSSSRSRASRAEAAGWLRVGAKPRTVHIIKGAKFESWLLEVRSCNQTGKLWPSLNICISYFPVMSSLARDLMRSEACLIKARVNFARLGY